MYEKFTDRARKVMKLANQEANRLNSQHVDTGSMLLGLAKEGSGVAANVLKNAGIDFHKLRLKVMDHVETVSNEIGTGKLPLTQTVVNVIELARFATNKFDHGFVGTEHLLLGLMRDEKHFASQVVRSFGVTPEAIIEDIHRLLGVDDASEDLVELGRNEPERVGQSRTESDVADQAPKTATIRIMHIDSHDLIGFHSIVELRDGVFFHVNSDNLIVFSQSDGTEYFFNVNNMIGLSVTPDKEVDPNGE